MESSAASSPAGPPTRSHRILIGLASAGAIIAALTVTLGLSVLIGSWARSSTLITELQPPPDVALVYGDAPDAGAFFDARDTITITVPWEMTVAEFLSFYHLENNADARRALREQLDVVDESAVLQEGTEVSLRLTARREARER